MFFLLKILSRVETTGVLNVALWSLMQSDCSRSLSGVMNPGEELKMVTAKSPLVLSILRVRLRIRMLL
jgi:hypothetical protein